MKDLQQGLDCKKLPPTQETHRHRGSFFFAIEKAPHIYYHAPVYYLAVD
jgi:hypothetical protein